MHQCDTIVLGRLWQGVWCPWHGSGSGAPAALGGSARVGALRQGTQRLERRGVLLRTLEADR